MTTWREISDQFLEFFRGHGHTIVPSSSLVPANDPTLLFTNAGMVQFKETFLGLERRPYVRAATLQKIMRVQGKHNDLENVGPSPWHHTFFFMLGNFSFGDYFKGDAIAYAWELVTRHYGVDRDRLVITVLQGDAEAEGPWRKVGIPTERILRLGEKTNFWTMGDVGPCGPTSELHFDWGSQYCTCGLPDCSVALDNSCQRWLEIWNLVFMQFDQRADGTRARLPKPGVDTGMGLERITTVLQGVHDNYRNEMFEPLMARVEDLIHQADPHRPWNTVAARVMGDHSRAMTFLMADGIVPGNEGRGYVLRMIMRRAVRFARSVGVTKPFLGELADVAIKQMSGTFPELERHRSFIMEAASAEEARFANTLDQGLSRLEDIIATARRRGETVLSGDEVFRLYDTFGFPVEMTRDIAKEHGRTVDEAGFAAAMDAQRDRARAAHAFAATGAEDRRFADLANEGVATEFIGYRKVRARAKVLAVFTDGHRVEEASDGTEVEVVIDRTPFYAEAGGQVGDTGRLRASRVEVEVLDTQRPAGGVIAHRGRITRGRLRVGMPITAEVDVARRLDTMRNHTATHLLHRALQELLGEHARQAGSLVAPDRLRFDFVHLASLSDEQREAIERRVNERILDDLPVAPKWMSYDEATKLGAMALFGEKYGDRVRVISIDEYSRELCGGTHVKRTGQIGMFKITSESGVAAGVRRIEGVTGAGVYALLRRHDSTLSALADQLRVSPDEVPDRVRRVLERVKDLERQVRSGTSGDGSKELLSRALEGAVDISGLRFVAADVPADDTETIRRLADQIRDRLDADHQPGVVVLASLATGQVVATRTRKTPVAVDVGRLVRSLTEAFGGSGGGRPEFAQGGLKGGGRVADLIALARDRTFLERVAQP